jgi:hypothetical protein
VQADVMRSEAILSQGSTRAKSAPWSRNQLLGLMVTIVLAVFLSFYNLSLYPRTWFDEGAHLHVPKALVTRGVYADVSAEGLRHYGPTIGVGPTVMLPVAAMFGVWGVGLNQARTVMALYLLLALVAVFLLARHLLPGPAALVAVAALLTAPGVGLIEYGRQVLGEVPALFFLALGLWVWFKSWDAADWPRLTLAGVLFGLACVTKNQYLLVLAPTLSLSLALNWLYYRNLPPRAFLVTGVVTALVYAIWYVVLLVYLGPATIDENVRYLREATAGAALVFDPELMSRSLTSLIRASVYLGALLPAVLYGTLLVFPRRRDTQQWSVLVVFVIINLAWYVIASIGWIRYAFPALALASLMVGRFFYDLTIGFWWPAQWKLAGLRTSEAVRAGLMVWMIAMLVVSGVRTAWDVLVPPPDDPAAMAVVMIQRVPLDVVVETWEPEMGFLTDHIYHYPPSGLLNAAVGHIWQDAESPSARYFPQLQVTAPLYVLEGEFARWVDIYPNTWLATHYRLIEEVGAYRLYERLP